MSPIKIKQNIRKVKKKKNKPILLSLDFNMICLSLTGEAHTSLK